MERSDDDTSKHVTVERSLLVGLIRAAALLESAERGRIWDDEAREALNKARALGLEGSR